MATKYLGYVETLPLVEALWWFIENNAPSEVEDATDIFFHLRERVRAHAKNDSTAATHPPLPSHEELVSAYEALLSGDAVKVAKAVLHVADGNGHRETEVKDEQQTLREQIMQDIFLPKDREGALRMVAEKLYALRRYVETFDPDKDVNMDSAVMDQLDEITDLIERS